jgi:hypothetical protein
MYETRHQKLLDPAQYARRVALHFLSACALLGFSLFGGMLGYHAFEHLPWLDAFLNSSMLLGGMGPVDTPHTEAGKLFAGLYALYSGLVFLVMVAVILAPMLHRLMHRFHWSEKE